MCHFAGELTGYKANFLGESKCGNRSIAILPDSSIGGYVQGVDAMAAWGITCLNCNRQFAQFNIENDLKNLYLLVKPDLPKGGKELAHIADTRPPTSEPIYSICADDPRFSSPLAESLGSVGQATLLCPTS